MGADARAWGTMALAVSTKLQQAGGRECGTANAPGELKQTKKTKTKNKNSFFLTRLLCLYPPQLSQPLNTHLCACDLQQNVSLIDLPHCSRAELGAADLVSPGDDTYHRIDCSERRWHSRGETGMGLSRVKCRRVLTFIVLTALPVKTIQSR